MLRSPHPHAVPCPVPLTSYGGEPRAEAHRAVLSRVTRPLPWTWPPKPPNSLKDGQFIEGRSVGRLAASIARQQALAAMADHDCSSFMDHAARALDVAQTEPLADDHAVYATRAYDISVSAPDMAPQIAIAMFIWLTQPQSIRPQCRTFLASRQSQALSTLAFQ